VNCKIAIFIVCSLIFFLWCFYASKKFWDSADEEMKKRIDACYQKKGKVVTTFMILAFFLGYDFFQDSNNN